MLITMKKILFLSLFISFKMMGQSVTIFPQTIDKVDNSSDDLSLTSYQFPSIIFGRRSNGTVLSKTPVQSGDFLFRINGGGWDGSSFQNGGRISFKATQDWGVNNGGAITFETTPNTSFLPIERMLINHDGRVGIGLPSPDKILDINGRIRLRHTSGFTSGIWMSNSTNGLTDADGAFFGMENDNKAGIWINNAWRFGVNNSGEISTSSMVGSGYRMVLASPTGTLLSNSQPQVWSISAGAFTPTTNGSAQFIKSTTSAYFSSGTSIMFTPVNLPTGVNVTEVVVFYKNSDPTNTLRVRLDALVLANSNIGAVSTPIIATGDLGMVTGIQSASLSLSPGEISINNANRAYYLRVTSNVWSSDMAIYGVKITYTY
jgi:hypothetical protein